MNIKQINDALSLMASIAICEIEESGKSIDYAAQINSLLKTMPNEVAEHFMDLWITIGRASSVNNK